MTTPDRSETIAEIEKEINDWKWGFIDKAPFYCVTGDEKVKTEVRVLNKDDIAYICRAVRRLAERTNAARDKWWLEKIVPEKVKPYQGNLVSEAFADGWNACVDQIKSNYERERAR